MIISFIIGFLCGIWAFLLLVIVTVIYIEMDDVLKSGNCNYSLNIDNVTLCAIYCLAWCKKITVEKTPQWYSVRKLP